VLSPPRPIDVLRVPVAFAVVEQRRVADAGDADGARPARR
jgi:hypothetical protein